MRFIECLDKNTFILMIGFRVGSIHEPLEFSGISHLLEHMMFKGTTSKKSIDRINVFNKAGAVFNASTSCDYTLYHVKCGVEDAATIVQEMFSVIRKLDVSQSEFEMEKKIVIEEFALDLNNSTTVFDLAHKNTPYAKSVIGTEETLNNITLADLNKYHEQMYTEPIICYSCSRGNKAIILKLLQAKSIHQEHKSVIHPLPMNLNEDRVLDSTSHIFSVEETQSCNLAYLGFPMSDPRSACAKLVAHILHQRMFIAAREKRGMLYTFKVDHNAWAHTGIFKIQFSTENSTVKKILKLMQQEIRAIASLTKAEIATYQRQLDKNEKIKYSNPYEACMLAMKQELYQGPIDVPPDCFDLTGIFSPKRIAFKIKTPRKQDSQEISKILGIK